MSTKQRFLIDPNVRLTDFAYLFLVQCPRCQCCANVIPELEPTREFINPYFPKRVRFLCSSCGAIKEKGANPHMRVGGSHDWYFYLPLYLQISCCGHVLWALNFEHLNYLERYVQADLRENSTLEDRRITTTYDQNISSRLPTWMKTSKNRKEVIRCIHKLKHL